MVVNTKPVDKNLELLTLSQLIAVFMYLFDYIDKNGTIV